MLTVGDLVQVLGDLPSHAPVNLITLNGESLNFDIDIKSERHGYNYNSTGLDIITDLSKKNVENIENSNISNTEIKEEKVETQTKQEKIYEKSNFTLRRLCFK